MRNQNRWIFAPLAAGFLFAAPASAQFGPIFDSKRMSEQNAGNQIAQPPPATKPAPQVTKSETVPVGNWLVMCNDYVNAVVKRACTAKLEIHDEKNNSVVFVWEIGLSTDKKIMSIMHFPTGVLIEHGVELRIGKAAPRKIPFAACAPTECSVQFPADPSFIRDVAANPSIEAVILAVNGSTPTFTINTAGIDKAYAQIAN
jgi:invasion protein IalB